MSQNSLVLPTTGTVSGLTQTQNTNAALDTLNTLASGASAPSSPEAGQLWHDTTNNTIYIYSLDSTTWIPLFVLNETAYTAVPYAGGPLGQCQFQATSTSVCTLVPWKGNKVTFPNGQVYTVPSAGLATVINNAYINGTAAQTLSASTLYYAYLWNNSGTYVIDWSTTAYATDTNSGITIKSGDATRVLVGMAYPNGSTQFSYGNNIKQVRSWFNDNGISTVASFSTTRSTTSGTATEINTEIRNSILTWNGESVLVNISGVASNGTTADGVITGIGINSTSSIQNGWSAGISSTGGFVVPVSVALSTDSITEGASYVTLLGSVDSGGTATWQQQTSVSVITRR
jgi:hypothetical protein